MPNGNNTSNNEVSREDVADPVQDDWLHFNEYDQICSDCGQPTVEGACPTCASDRKIMSDVLHNGKVR